MGLRKDMPIDHGMEEMWQLAGDRRSVRMSLLVDGLRTSIEFEAAMVDQLIDRLSVLRAQMQPGPPPARNRN